MYRPHRKKQWAHFFRRKMLLFALVWALFGSLPTCFGMSIQEWKELFYDPDLVELIASDIDELISLNRDYVRSLREKCANGEEASGKFKKFLDETENYEKAVDYAFVKKAILFTFLGHYSEISRSGDSKASKSIIEVYRKKAVDTYLEEIKSFKPGVNQAHIQAENAKRDKELVGLLKSICKSAAGLSEENSFFAKLEDVVRESESRFDVFARLFGKWDYMYEHTYERGEKGREIAKGYHKYGGAWRPEFIRLCESYHEKFLNLINRTSLRIFFPLKALKAESQQ